MEEKNLKTITDISTDIFKPFEMSVFYQSIPAGLDNFHASNPQPWTVEELETLLQQSIFSIPSDLSCHYDSTQGDPKLRDTIATHLFDQLNASHIVTTCGAQEAIFCLYHALLQPGDHVVAFTPSFEPLLAIPQHMGCHVTTVPLSPDNGWQPDLEALNKAINHNTKLLVINFPHNPTGAHIDEQCFRAIVELCRQRQCWLFSDEVFRGLEHDPLTRLPTAADVYERGISLNVMSKAFALPAIRLGWLACQDTVLLTRIQQIKSQLSICNSRLDVHVSTEVIPHHEAIYQRNTAIIRDNKQNLEQCLANYPDIDCVIPEGASTCFPILKKRNSMDFSQQLMHEHRLLVLPQKVFLTQHNGFRLALGFRDSVKRLQQVLELTR